MTYRFIDRLRGHSCDVPAEDMVLGRFMVEPLGDDSTFLNSIAIAQPSFCVPDLRGHWQLMEPGRDRVEGDVAGSGSGPTGCDEHSGCRKQRW